MLCIRNLIHCRQWKSHTFQPFPAHDCPMPYQSTKQQEKREGGHHASHTERGKEATTQATRKEGRRPPRKPHGKREGGCHTSHTERGKEGTTQPTRKEGRRPPGRRAPHKPHGKREGEHHKGGGKRRRVSHPLAGSSASLPHSFLLERHSFSLPFTAEDQTHTCHCSCELSSK